MSPIFLSKKEITLMYSPKINEKHIPALYHLGKHVKKPMTRLVNQAIAEFLSKEENQIRK
jgi:hypothetical protein